MTTQNVHSGTRFQLRKKSSPSDTTGTLIAMAVTKDLSRDRKFDEATVVDAGNPNSIPVRKSVATQETFDINLSGRADFVKYRELEADFEAGDPIDIIAKIDEAAAKGGGQWDCAVFIESLKFSASNNGIVDFTAKLRGEGKIVFTAASA